MSLFFVLGSVQYTVYCTEP